MHIQTDIKKMLSESGWSQGRLAKEAGLNLSALSKFLGRRDQGRAIAERVWPFIYGDKRPPIKTSPPAEPVPTCHGLDEETRG